jgi:hypothetical protein
LARERDFIVAEVIQRLQIYLEYCQPPFWIVALLVARLALKLETRKVAFTLALTLPDFHAMTNG